MKRFNLLVMVAALVVAFASTAFAAPQFAEVCAQPKVASFDFLIDYSGSMHQKHKKLDAYKFELGRKALLRVIDRTPLLGFTGSIHTIGTAGEVVPQQTFDRAIFAAGVNSLNDTYEVFNRLSPLGDGIAHWSGALYSTLPQPTAVVLVSDGENNRGIDPLAAAQAAINANPRLTFHVISVADTEEGFQTLKSIADLKNDGIIVEANALIGNDHEVGEFVYDAFCSSGKLVLRSVQFALGSAVINQASASVLDEVANILTSDTYEGIVRSSRFHNRPRHIVIEGHTCDIGSEASNQRLSERRAASVKSYLVKKGVAATLITTKGFGELRPKYDNSTNEGRSLNRRAEIDFQ